MADTILFRLEGGLAWITLNRPEARNAINDEMRRALLDAPARTAGDPALRAAVLTGAGEGFCPGADLWGGRRDAAPPAHATRALMKQNSQRLIRAVLELEKPVVAAVNGVAAGMGAHLALACDLVVMAAEARLVEVFARRGIAIDSAGAFLLSRLVGLLKAKELVLLADDVPADEALRLGLCNKVVLRAELEAAARVGRAARSRPDARSRHVEAPPPARLRERARDLPRGGGARADAGRRERGHAGGRAGLRGEAEAGVQRTLNPWRTRSSAASACSRWRFSRPTSSACISPTSARR